jgi:plastocyanin
VRTRRAAVPALAAAALLPAGAAAMPGHGGGDAPAAVTSVEMGFEQYAPQRITVLTGEEVRWHNVSVRDHTVTADDGSFDSGRVDPGDGFSRTIAAPGTLAYHCTLHVAMRGTIEARTVLLTAPATPAAAGRPYPLEGRSALAAGTELAVEADAGHGFREVTRTTVDADGTFTALVRPTTSVTLRVVAAGAESNAVALLVLDRRVSVTTRRLRGRDVVTATVTPSSPGGHVALQLRIPERFGWWPVLRARLDARSQARFTVRGRRRLPARVRLTLPDGATALAESRVVHVGPVRRAK